MEGLFSLLLFAGFFYFMMRFGCGAHMIHGHGGHSGHEHGSDGAVRSAIDPVRHGGRSGSRLARTERMTAVRFQRMVNHESGLLGVSGTSADLRDLLAREARDARAADAVGLFCYQAKKWIGSFAAAGLSRLLQMTDRKTRAK